MWAHQWVVVKVKWKEGGWKKKKKKVDRGDPKERSLLWMAAVQHDDDGVGGVDAAARVLGFVQPRVVLLQNMALGKRTHTQEGPPWKG